MPRRASTTEEQTPAQLVRMVNARFPGAMTTAADPRFEIERLPTGILSVDIRLNGGFPRGRHIEIFGGYNVGKTFLTYRFIAQCQADGLKCAFIDVEGTFDPIFAENAGVILEELDFPERGQSANRIVNIMEALLRSHLYDCIVLDSIAALVPQQELESDMESGNFGTAQAKLMSQALRRLTAANARTVIVYINQTREAVGGSVFAKRSITSGGRAMGFYAGTRLELVRTETIKRPGKTIDISKGNASKKDIVTGHRVLVRVEKDKTGIRTATETTFVFDYETANIDAVEDLIYLGRVYDLVLMSGQKWWVDGYDDEACAGRKRFKAWLSRNVAVQEELEERIRDAAEASLVGQDEGEAEPEEWEAGEDES